MSHPVAAHHTDPVLPGELTDRIVDFLHDDWRALAACVHTPLAPESARYHLSTHVVLQLSDAHTELPDFLATFPARSPLAELIHSIHIRGPPVGEHAPPRAVFPPHADLSHFLHLRALTLSHLFVEAAGRMLRFLCRLPALEELSLGGLAPRATPPELEPDIGPEVDVLRLFFGRLRVVRVVDVEWVCLGARRIDEPAMPEVLLQILEYVQSRRFGPAATPREVVLCVDDAERRARWVRALCPDDDANLRHAEVTLYEPIGLTEPGSISVLDEASQQFLRSIPTMLSQRSLCIRYEPWRKSGAEQSASETINLFLKLLSLPSLTRPQTLHGAPGTHTSPQYPGIQSLELALQIPPDARADSDGFWTALFRSWNPECWPNLGRVRIALEPLTSIPSTGKEAHDAVETYAEAVRGALRTSGDVHPEVEVIVRAQSPPVDSF